MEPVDLSALPKSTLIDLLKIYSRNWQSLDGLWFGNVEAGFGLEAARRIDLKNWEKQALLEARRIKNVLNLNEGGLGAVLKVLSLMSWQLTAPLFKIESETPQRVVFFWDRCAVQESRVRNGKPLFPCKTMKLTLLSGIARIAEPRTSVRCLACPPDPHPKNYWCRWELTIPDQASISTTYPAT